MAIPCKSVDEAVQALDEQFGYTGEMLMDSINTLHSTWITLPELQKRREMIQWSKPNDPATWDVDVEDALKDHRFGWGTYSNTATAAGNLTVESLQKAIEDMRKLVEERIEVRMFDVWSDYRPVDDQPKEGSMDDRRLKAGDIVEYKGRRHTVFCRCNSLWRGSYYGQHMFDWDDVCPDCDYHYWYEDTDGVTPPVQESSSLDSLADVLPDLYGRKEHAAYMARTARAEHAQNVERKTAVQLRVRSLMDGLCGKHRGMED